MDDPTHEQIATTVAHLRQRIADLEASAAVLDSVLDCIITMDADGRVIEFNAAAERTFGYTKADAIGRVLTDLIIPPLLRDAHAAGLARYLATGEGQLIGKLIEMTAMRSDGSEIPVELAITAIRSDKAPIFTGVFARHHGPQSRRGGDPPSRATVGVGRGRWPVADPDRFTRRRPAAVRRGARHLHRGRLCQNLDSQRT